jgi:hypothetical protein
MHQYLNVLAESSRNRKGSAMSLGCSRRASSYSHRLLLPFFFFLIFHFLEAAESSGSVRPVIFFFHFFIG